MRVYLTDDDFATQSHMGAGPHHQGDVTFIDDAGNELGWINGGWAPGSRPVPPATGSLYASAPDSKTGHDRGPFGNDDLWGHIPGDVPYQVAQQLPIPLPLSGALLGAFVPEAKMFLDVSTAWQYTDQDNSGTFNPADGQDANSEEAGWAPVLPKFRFL